MDAGQIIEMNEPEAFFNQPSTSDQVFLGQICGDLPGSRAPRSRHQPVPVRACRGGDSGQPIECLRKCLAVSRIGSETVRQ